MRNLGLANSLAGLIAAYPSFTVPFVTWLLMGYFESIPEELEEAAMIDGATRFGAFYRVVLPLSAPGVLAGRPLRLHAGVERVPLRAGLHHRRAAAHAAGRAGQLHHR
jgi:ABC-type maltose transport system permease subunit